MGFYLSCGCRLADPVHPTLFEHEPDDIHVVFDLCGISEAVDSVLGNVLPADAQSYVG